MCGCMILNSANKTLNSEPQDLERVLVLDLITVCISFCVNARIESNGASVWLLFENGFGILTVY